MLTTRVDQLGDSGHLERMDADRRDVAAAGATVLRYGMPWGAPRCPRRLRLVAVGPGLAAAEAAGVEVVVDLCPLRPARAPLCGPGSAHRASLDPAWVGTFSATSRPSWPATAKPRWFTPVNEPTTTAFCSASWGRGTTGVNGAEDHGRALVLCELADAPAAAIRADRPAAFPGAEALQIPRGAPGSGRRGRPADLAVVRGARPGVGHDLDPAAEDLPGSPTWLERLAPVADPTGIVAGHDLYPVSVHPYGAGGPTRSS